MIFWSRQEILDSVRFNVREIFSKIQNQSKKSETNTKKRSDWQTAYTLLFVSFVRTAQLNRRLNQIDFFQFLWFDWSSSQVWLASDFNQKRNRGSLAQAEHFARFWSPEYQSMVDIAFDYGDWECVSMGNAKRCTLNASKYLRCRFLRCKSCNLGMRIVWVIDAVNS